MIEQLFGSKTRVKLLKLFYANPNRSFYVREITRKIDEQINSVRRELSNLLSVGIISSDTNNNRLYYEVNQNYEFYQQLSVIFSGMKDEKTSDKNPKPDDPIKSLGNISLIVYTGQFTRDDTPGVDVLIVGNVNQTKVNQYVANLEKEEGKEIRYVTMSQKEFEYRKQIHDKFLTMVLSAKKQIIIDRHNSLDN